jgi:hypothetical protein
MSTTTITQLHIHPVHLDPVDQALALLVDSGLLAGLVCDGSCGGASSCTVAPVGEVPTAA